MIRLVRLRAGQRLFLSYFVLSLVTVGTLTLAVGATVRRQLTGQVSDALRRELRLGVSFYDQNPAIRPDPLADSLGILLGRRATVIRRDGVVVGDSEVAAEALPRLENHGNRTEVRAALAGRVGEAVRASASVGYEQVYVASPTGRGEVLRLAYPLGFVADAVRQVQRALVWAGLAVLVFGAVLSLAFSMAVTRPLRRMRVVARELATGNLSRRVGERRSDEIGELGEALDALADQLQRRLAELEAERGEMQALIDTMAEGVVALAPDGTVRRANPAARRMLRLRGEVRGLNPMALARRPEFLRVIDEAMGGTPVPATDFTLGAQHLLATAQPLDAGGAVLVILDVSRLRRLEAVRRDFVANASHELKTPLTAIRGYSETLLDPDLPPELRRRFAETVRNHADRLQRVVDDLLDLSRIESGGWRAEPEPVEVRAAVEQAFQPFADDLGRKQVAFDVDLAPGAEWVLADPLALNQILSNLLSNACRFTQEGGKIAVHARPDPAEAGWIVLEVSDTGSGIPAAHLPRIWERFYRVDAARSREEGGTGLGLAIVRHLVEAHGGRVDAESKLGEGTTIRFTLPRSRPATAN